ncbi:MAG: MBL fold metallo-hydrolase [Propionibacteriales bacterium]|nr:MBL fold metallo-hydrolase [Propionibacteriales bacterium]
MTPAGTDLRIDHAVTSGTFSLDGETFDVDNNVWVVGNDDECVVIDAPHDVDAILRVVADRRVLAILCTHAHDDHVRVAPQLAAAVEAPILLHRDDLPVWELTHPGSKPDGPLTDGKRIIVGDSTLVVMHTPGHAPGAVCFYAEGLGVVFTGDTLFHGGPGATGRSFSDRARLEASIRARLFSLPDETVVHTGHGDSTTIGAEAAALGR